VFEKEFEIETNRGNPGWKATETCHGVYSRAASSGAHDWLLKALLDLRPCPCFLLRPDLSVSLMNAAALESQKKLGISVSQNGMLRFENAQAGKWLAAAIKGFLNEREDVGSPALLSCEQPDGNPAALFVRPLLSGRGAKQLGSGHEGSWFLVSVRPSLTSLKINALRIASTLRLTRAEAGLAAALVEGLSLHDYAEREDLKITTVRWHLRNIFERTGARNQQEVISMIVSLFG
jgi:DNA-binding CsgD family transcriptional regulator